MFFVTAGPAMAQKMDVYGCFIHLMFAAWLQNWLPSYRHDDDGIMSEMQVTTCENMHLVINMKLGV